MFSNDHQNETQRGEEVLDGFISMKTAYNSQLHQEEIKHALCEVSSQNFELTNFINVIALVQTELTNHQQALESKVLDQPIQRSSNFQAIKERCLRMKEMNQVLLQKTLNLRQSLASLLPKSRTYHQRFDNQLGRIVDKIKFRKNRAMQKISQVKYFRANRQLSTSSTKISYGTVSTPMKELKNASEILAKRSLLFYEEMKGLIASIQRENMHF